MTSDVSRETFLLVLRKSRLVDDDVLDRVSPQPAAGSARGLADLLIAAGAITRYQAEKLLRGRWRGLNVGPYRLLAPLGRGGMGTVYLARDLRPAAKDEPLLALKVLPPHLVQARSQLLARFQRELELGRKTLHPNVARTLDGGESDGVNYIAMEYVPGKTVRELVLEGGGLPVADVARIFADVAAGLTHLHERGMIHRDLKPSNVMVTPAGRAKILDLGLALVPFDPRPADPSIVGGHGYIVGTMDYIAPEQARDATAVTPRSDLYSLGCSMYYALTGTPPFPGGTSKDKIRWQRTVEPAPIVELKPTVDPGFARIVEQLMAKEASARPPSASVVRGLLMPWAAPCASPMGVTAQEAVGTVDLPDAHPELWSDDSTAGNRGENDSATSVELEQGEEQTSPLDDRAQWFILGGMTLLLVLLIVILSILRGM